MQIQARSRVKLFEKYEVSLVAPDGTTHKNVMDIKEVCGIDYQAVTSNSGWRICKPVGAPDGTIHKIYLCI